MIEAIRKSEVRGEPIFNASMVFMGAVLKEWGASYCSHNETTNFGADYDILWRKAG